MQSNNYQEVLDAPIYYNRLVEIRYTVTAGSKWDKSNGVQDETNTVVEEYDTTQMLLNPCRDPLAVSVILERADVPPPALTYTLGNAEAPLLHSKLMVQKQGSANSYTCGDIEYLVYWDTQEEPCTDITDTTCVCGVPGDLSTCSKPAKDELVTYKSLWDGSGDDETPLYKPDDYYPGVDPVTNPQIATTLRLYANDRDLLFYKQTVQYKLLGRLVDYPDNFNEWFGTVTYTDPCDGFVSIQAPFKTDGTGIFLTQHFVLRGESSFEGIAETQS